MEAEGGVIEVDCATRPPAPMRHRLSRLLPPTLVLKKQGVAGCSEVSGWDEANTYRIRSVVLSSAACEEKVRDVVGEAFAMSVDDDAFRSGGIGLSGRHAVSDKRFGTANPFSIFDRLVA
jgi:hypothetical protein